jgi:NRPS condensation-like uncharacterized protein
MEPRISLSALEEYFFLEDRPAYPWSFFVRLDFIGRTDQAAAELALKASLARHPLLTSIVQREGKTLVWEPVQNVAPAVRWTTMPETAERDRAAPIQPGYSAAARLDIEKEIGLRAHFEVGRESTRLTFQFHHAACDARGATTFISDWLAEYGRAMGDQIVPALPHKVDSALLARRESVAPAALNLWETVRCRWTSLVRAMRFLTHTPTPLVDYQPAPDDHPAAADYPASRGFCFDAESTAELFSAAKRRGATVNDFLCCQLFLALRDFRRELGERPDAWLRLVVPVDLRTETHRCLSAVNLTSLIFLTRRADACDNPAALLQGIHDEMRRVKVWKLGRTFFQGLKFRRRLPGGLARGVRSAKCQGTATLTNIGEIFAGSPLARQEGRLLAGNLLLNGADFLPPIRPLTCTSFSASTYAGRLSINLHFDPQGLPEEASGRLLEALVGHLRKSLR